MFFPQLIAGPIVLHREMGRQLAALAADNWSKALTFGPGFAIFCFGLFKKVCLADNLAPFVDSVFNWPAHVQFIEAWCGAVGYALQLFFDFSGYSDMAVGLGLMFGFVLPFNFNVPFAATSMTEYWKRWHITMTRFFTMYCYTPLALSAHRAVDDRGIGRTAAFLRCIAVPTLVTFLASGLWHGAGFLIQRFWQALVVQRVAFLSAPNPVVFYASVATNFAFVAVGWLLFAAPTVPDAYAAFVHLFG